MAPGNLLRESSHAEKDPEGILVPRGRRLGQNHQSCKRGRRRHQEQTVFEPRCQIDSLNLENNH